MAHGYDPDFDLGVNSLMSAGDAVCEFGYGFVIDVYKRQRKDSRKLFEGLEITENQALCVEWMNQYPTIFVSFRQVDGQMCIRDSSSTRQSLRYIVPAL